MLILESIKIHNFLSYKDLEVDLTKYKVCQLIGDNGSGKTNIISAITEAAFGKNIRGYSKEELSNRFTDEEGYSLILNYSNNFDKYIASTKRTASKVTVSLKKNGIDISGHTVKDSYKAIEDSFGYSFDMFMQMIYQSSDFSMNFLEATPATRRNFLTNFIGVNEIQDDITKVGDNLKALKAKHTSLASTIFSVSSMLSTAKEGLQEIQQKLQVLEVPLTTEDACYFRIMEANRKIEQIKASKTKEQGLVSNINSLKSQLAAISVVSCEFAPLPAKQDLPPEASRTQVDVLEANLVQLNKELAQIKLQNQQHLAGKPKTSCHVCGSSLSNDTALLVFEDKSRELAESLKCKSDEISLITTKATILTEEYTTKLREYNAVVKANDEINKEQKRRDSVLLTNANQIAKQELLQNQLEKATSIYAEFSAEPDNLAELEEEVKQANADILLLKSSNTLLNSKASKEESIKTYDAKLKELTEQDIALSMETAIATTLSNALKEVLAKTFEDSLQLLERLTNNYLAVFSNGMFAIKFVADASALNIKLFNKGLETKLHTASKGQKTRITISCLLAIRKLLISMAKQPINLLILDEVVGVLDSDGKEQLLSILEHERELNIYLVSHEWTHPLLNKIFVTVDKKGFTHYEHE